MKMIVVGNWKMNLAQSSAREFVGSLAQAGAVSDGAVDVIVCPPFTIIGSLSDLRKEGISIGAQNCHHVAKGAYTGEISAEMLIDVGCSYVILGHSERRRDQHEDNELIGRKAHHALQSGLRPIICIGETLEQRQNGETFSVIKDQLDKIITSATAECVSSCIIAYEPIWAIGTGLAASAEQAEEVHVYIREHLKACAVADLVPLLYGGSVTADNAAALFACRNIDGALVGGASLKVDEFSSIVQAAREVVH
jgi:triosephosphate isomerase